jgi:hypothetical protein
MCIHTNVCTQLLARLGKTLPAAMLARVIMLPALSHEVLRLLALLVQILTQTALLGLCVGVAPSRCHARFAYFTSTNVKILTQKLGEQEYLQVWQLVDVTLDSFPCGGHASTMDALAAHSPVVTLPHQLLCGRGSQARMLTYADVC